MKYAGYICATDDGLKSIFFGDAAIRDVRDVVDRQNLLALADIAALGLMPGSSMLTARAISVGARRIYMYCAYKGVIEKKNGRSGAFLAVVFFTDTRWNCGIGEVGENLTILGDELFSEFANANRIVKSIDGEAVADFLRISSVKSALDKILRVQLSMPQATVGDVTPGTVVVEVGDKESMGKVYQEICDERNFETVYFIRKTLKENLTYFPGGAQLLTWPIVNSGSSSSGIENSTLGSPIVAMQQPRRRATDKEAPDAPGLTKSAMQKYGFDFLNVPVSCIIGVLVLSCFLVWLLLHVGDLDAVLSRQESILKQVQDSINNNSSYLVEIKSHFGKLDPKVIGVDRVDSSKSEDIYYTFQKNNRDLTEMLKKFDCRAAQISAADLPQVISRYNGLIAGAVILANKTIVLPIGCRKI